MPRSCGPCTACCTVIGVREGLGAPKPPGVPCTHLAACGGCSIYKSRPEECRTYACLWLQGMGSIEDRPDLLGVVYDHQPHPDNPQGLVIVRVHRPGAEKGARVRWNIRELLQRGFWVAVSNPPPEGGDFIETGTSSPSGHFLAVFPDTLGPEAGATAYLFRQTDHMETDQCPTTTKP